MVLQMVRPSKHPDSGIYYLRQRTPRDLVGKLPTQKVRFPAHAGGGVATVKPNASHIKVSLGTREPSVAKVRHGAALAHLEAFWAALRLGPKTLSQRQIEALAGDLYQRFAQGLEDNPGSPSRWANLRSFNKQVSAGRGSVLAIIGIGLTEKERREHSFETRYGSLVDALLASHNIIPDQASRRRLIERVHIALDQAAAKLQRNADGDFQNKLCLINGQAASNRSVRPISSLARMTYSSRNSRTA